MQKVELAPFKVIGLSIRTTNENNQALKDIGELWGKLMSENILAQIPNKLDDAVYSIYTQYESDHTKPYTVLLGCKVSNIDIIPEGLTGMSFSGGRYTKLTTKGDLNEGIVGKKWGEIWNMNLDRVFTADFEVYGEKAQNPKDAEIDFYIATN